ncbi:hypothetical protein SAMN05428989_3782 [Pseudoxanthomonas sp. GM95]|nr:hypothetical protein SAMN05428989_3782 [Pseudoxanthomonas sp. GM95]
MEKRFPSSNFDRHCGKVYQMLPGAFVAHPRFLQKVLG